MSKHNKEPKITEFRFSMGGFSSGHTSLELMGGKIVHKETGWIDGEEFFPTQESWDVFSDSLISLCVWRWKRTHNTLDYHEY